jgi:apolipoprotein N-acyltransferase
MYLSPFMYRKYPSLLLSLLSGLLLSASWYWGLGILIFVAFVPLLFIEDRLYLARDNRSNLKVLGYAYLSFIIWNVLVTWWVVYASFGGALMAFLFNSLFMALVLVIFSAIKKRLNKDWAVWILIPLWIAWEHGHTLWDLSWPWLTLGNVFAFQHNWVQWYEFTGTSGGTLWILMANIIAFNAIKKAFTTQSFVRAATDIAAAVIIPMFISYIILLAGIVKPEKEKQLAIPVIIVQPNIDPYNVKFYLDYQSQFLKMLNLVRDRLRAETEYLVLPETFITDDINEDNIHESEAIQWFRDSLISKYPRLKIITGANTYQFYNEKKDITATARLDQRSGKYYDVYNTAVCITTDHVRFYHKSKLVPGVERMPFPALLKPLEKLAIDMGGTMGSLGTQFNRSVFSDPDSRTSVAPVICYESIYADYLTEYIRKDADFIFIITNDGWWENTPGYKQHLNYAKLRAIENRRQIARSANTGISCFIDEYGNISQPTDWWQEAVIEKNLYKNPRFTFFSRYGDLISYSSVLFCAMIVFWSVFPGVRDKLLNKP